MAESPFLPSKSPSSLRVKTAVCEFNADCSIDLRTDSADFTRSEEGDFGLRRSPRWNPSLDALVRTKVSGPPLSNCGSD